MSLRRAGLLALPLALAACTEVTQQPPPADIVFASFASPNIPTPNDLALAGMVTRSLPGFCGTPVDLCAAPPNAQVELLCSFRAAGGFPSDIESPISIPVLAKRWNPTGGTGDFAGLGDYEPAAPPDVDLATVTDQTVSVYRIDGVAPVAYKMGTGPTDATAELKADWVAAPPCAGGTCPPGVLRLHLRASPGSSSYKPWPASARIAYALRGGPNGVKTTTGLPLAADSAIAFTIPNRDLTKPENQPFGAIPDGSAEGSCGEGTNSDEIALLENVRGILWNPLPWCYMPAVPPPSVAGWNPVTTPAAAAACANPPPTGLPTPTASVYGVVTAFPYAETATAGAFGTAPSAGTSVVIDPGSGVAPLPFDLLRTDADGTVINNPGFGPLAAGLDTLDGFSTTALVFAPTSGTIDASSVTAANVLVYKLGGAAPTLVRDLASALGAGTPAAARYLTQPPPIVVTQAQGCPIAGGCSSLIGLQPAIGAAVPGVGTFYLPPLDQKSDYAVVVTSRVRSVGGTGLVRSTLSKALLEFTNPFVVNGKSAIPGLSDAQAAGAAAMKAQLDAIWPVLPAGTTKADVAAAYTFRTQTVTDGAAAVLPFAAAAAPLGATFYTPAQIGGAYGVDAAVAFPGTAIAEFAEVPFNTNNLLLSGRAQGAFDPGQPTPEQVTALVAIPDPALVTGPCPAGFTATRCAPLVVFRHGIPRAKGDMLPIASALAAKGFVVAAIDAEKHGDRTYCAATTQAAADQQCLSYTGGTSTCVHDPRLKTAADAETVVGRCSDGLLRKRVDCALPDPQCFAPATLAPKGIPAASGQYIFSLNLFRTRDSLRQDVIDQAALVNALAPTAPRAAGADAFADHLLAQHGLAVNPNEVYFASLSLGSENATLSVAVNPRFKKGAFHAGFATIVDDLSNPASSDNARLLALLASADPPVLPGTPAYLQFLQVAKWILDPADAASYAPLIAASAKPVLSQIGLCDTRIPNAQSQYFSAMLGLPVPAAGTAGTGFTQWFIDSAATASCPADGVDHGFLVDPTQSPSLTAQAQASFADFLATGAAQPTTVRP